MLKTVASLRQPLLLLHSCGVLFRNAFRVLKLLWLMLLAPE